MVQSQKKYSRSWKSRFFKIRYFTCMGAWFWRVQPTQNLQKTQKNRFQEQAKKKTDFQTSFILILEPSGDPIWVLWMPILRQRGRGTPDLSSPGEYCANSGCLWRLFARPGALLGEFVIKNGSKVIKSQKKSEPKIMKETRRPYHSQMQSCLALCCVVLRNFALSCVVLCFLVLSCCAR